MVQGPVVMLTVHPCDLITEHQPFYGLDARMRVDPALTSPEVQYNWPRMMFRMMGCARA